MADTERNSTFIVTTYAQPRTNHGANSIGVSMQKAARLSLDYGFFLLCFSGNRCLSTTPAVAAAKWDVAVSVSANAQCYDVFLGWHSDLHPKRREPVLTTPPSHKSYHTKMSSGTLKNPSDPLKGIRFSSIIGFRRTKPYSPTKNAEG